MIPFDQQNDLFERLRKEGYNFFCGVPDSSLKSFINAINESNLPHVHATWEAEAIGIAAGAFLAGKKPCVYMQNAGLPFALNPIASLCLPCGINLMIVVGHRHSLPQHYVMGVMDQDLLNSIGVEYKLVDSPDE